MCFFVKATATTEMAAFYESRAASIFDLEPKPQSRSVYRACITPIGGKLPDWAVVSQPRQTALTLTPIPPSRPLPPHVQFSIFAQLTLPALHSLPRFGDGT